jgi:hypothetical protein
LFSFVWRSAGDFCLIRNFTNLFNALRAQSSASALQLRNLAPTFNNVGAAFLLSVLSFTGPAHSSKLLQETFGKICNARYFFTDPPWGKIKNRESRIDNRKLKIEEFPHELREDCRFSAEGENPTVCRFKLALITLRRAWAVTLHRTACILQTATPSLQAHRKRIVGRPAALHPGRDAMPVVDVH